VLAVWIVVLVVMATALTMGICAAQSAQGRLVYRPILTEPVLVLVNEGLAAYQAGDFRNAEKKYQEALKQARSLKDKPGIGASLGGLGTVYQDLKEYPKALEFYSEALTYFTDTNDLAGQWMRAPLMPLIDQLQLRNKSSRVLNMRTWTSRHLLCSRLGQRPSL
jgi:tetratricopeptide (TPR) repeat protein